MIVKRLDRLSSKHYLLAILALLFVLDVFTLWFTAKVDYDRTLDRARIVLQKTSISLEERMKRTVIATEAILHGRALRIQEKGIAETISSVKEWERFRSAAQGLPDAGSIWLLDNKGNLLMDSTEYPSQRMNFSEREYFAPQRDLGIELYIGPVVKGKITRKYSFTISHRINGNDGSFLGIVLAAIDIDDFTNFLSNINIGENSTVTVFRTDGSMILRQPMQDEYLGKTFKNLKLFSMPFNEVPSGIYETDAIDGIKRLIAYRKVQGLPLLVATGIPVDSVLKEWRARVKVYSLIAAIAFLALMGLSWLAHRITSREEEEKAKELSDSNLSLKAEIVERERSQLALRKSEQRWATTLASIGDAVLASDAEGSITFMNAVAEELTGWTLMDAATKPVPEVFNIINEQTRKEVENPVTKVIREGMIVGLANHTILVRKDGTEVPIDDSGAPIRDQDGKTIGVVLVFRDITARKQAEEELHKSRMDLERAQEVGQIGSWQLDIRRNVLTWSDENHRIFGVTKGTPLTYEGFLAIIHPDDRQYVDKQWNAGLAGEPYDIEHRIVVNGQVKWVREKAYLEFDDTGSLLGGFGITQDITERKQLEEELRRSRDDLDLRVRERTDELQQAYQKLVEETEDNQRLEAQLRQAQKMEAIGTLAGGIAHDFNNILAAIIGFSEMVEEDLPPGDPSTPHVQRVLNAASRGRELVQQILAFSRKTEHARHPVSISFVAKETVQFLRATIPKTIEIILDNTATADTILATPVEVQQVLLNLATNAALSMQDKGGILHVSIADMDVEPYALVLESDIVPGEYVQIAVRDTGIGIAPDVMKRIFEPFFTTREAGQGTGMGLAVVYGIVKSLHGSIMVESEPGVGSTFQVLLPKVTTAKRTEAPLLERSLTGKERVLFIDDEEFLVEWGQALLERMGYEVTAMNDSIEAFEAFSSDPSRFDLVITDQTMPGITGLNLAREVLKIRSDIPVILCTGHSESVTLDKLKEAGVREFLMKPLAKKDLAEVIRRVLDKETKA